MRMKLEDLKDALEIKLVEIEAIDKARLERHKQLEQKWLKDTRDRLSELAKIDDYSEMVEAVCVDQWGNRLSYIYGRKFPERPPCPIGHAKEIRQLLRSLQFDSRKTLTLSPGGANGELFQVLTRDYENSARNLCE